MLSYPVRFSVPIHQSRRVSPPNKTIVVLEAMVIMGQAICGWTQQDKSPI